MNTTLPQSAKPAAGKRYAAIGVTAGLLGGGAIGLLMTMPSFTSAASDDTADTADVAAEAVVAALQDDGTTDDATAAASERPEPGVRLREMLQPLVDDDTITAGQADAVTSHLVENRPDRDGRRHGPLHRRGAFDGEVVAELIGIDVEVLRDELRSGKSIADIAAENGADVDGIVAALVDQVESHLDLAVENGRLTDEEAAEKLANAETRITARINGERPTRN